MIFATSIFCPSDALKEMLRVLLFSVHKNTPSTLYVYYSDCPTSFIESLRGVIPVSVDREIKSDTEKASQKMFFWDRIVDCHPGEEIILLDCDTLVLADCAEVFSKSFNIAYTAKDNVLDQSPLNTGVVFLRNNKYTSRLMKQWKNETEKILNDTVLLDYAVRLFGGADQLALAYVIGKTCNFHGPQENGFFGLSAMVYNLHKYWEDVSRAKIIHFKSGWAGVLTQQGEDFAAALKASPWGGRKGLMETAGPWKPSFDVWKKYQRECHGH